MTEQASQWTIGDGGRPKRSTTTRALGLRKHPDDGLRCHLSLIRRSATPPPPMVNGVWLRPPWPGPQFLHLYPPPVRWTDSTTS
jgi:hypothetical protein